MIRGEPYCVIRQVLTSSPRRSRSQPLKDGPLSQETHLKVPVPRPGCALKFSISKLLNCSLSLIVKLITTNIIVKLIILGTRCAVLILQRAALKCRFFKCAAAPKRSCLGLEWPALHCKARKEAGHFLV